jgi:hypothetical protein
VANMTEAEARKAADARGWKLEKRGKSYRLTSESGTVVAGDWAQPDEEYFGLSLADVADALEQ